MYVCIYVLCLHMSFGKAYYDYVVFSRTYLIYNMN